MRQPLRMSCAASVPLLLLTACVDDNYDLSDIDTTMRFEVNNLTVPVNIDNIELRSIFDLKEDGTVKEINGQFAILQDGTFTSDEIHISPFTIPAPYIAPYTASIPDAGAGRFPVMIPEIPFSTMAENVSECIVSIDKATTHARMSLTLAAEGHSLRLENAVIQLPAGLTATSPQGQYDSATGELSITSSIPLSAPVTLDITGIDLAKAGMTFDNIRRTVTFSSAVGIKSATVTVDGSTPASLRLTAGFSISEIPAETLTGRIDYPIENVDVTDITLDNLPDILADENTRITLVNPQIYLAIHNPLQQQGAYASSGVTIQAFRDDILCGTFSPEPNYFRTGTDHADGIYNFCLAPAAAEYDSYPEAAFVPFPSLRNVLLGAGLPSMLSVALDNPRFPDQYITGLPLGVDLGKAYGNYTFYAPLAFGPDSRIVYTDHLDGWGSDDLDYMVITRLDIAATVSTDIPIELDFTGYPIDREGRQIDGVEIVGAKVPANAKNHELHIYITGNVRDLDGIRFSALATTDASESALTPGMCISLKNIRPTVSGYYEKEL